MSSDQQEGAPASEQGPIERVVEGALGGMAAVAESLMEHVPGTAEHAIRRHLEEHGDMNVETGEPLPRDAGALRPMRAPAPRPPPGGGAA